MTPRRTAFAALAIATFAVIAAPASASGAGIYPPDGSCTVSPTTTSASGKVIFECVEGTFSASEPVTVTVTGESGQDAEIGMIRTAISTASAVVGSEAPLRSIPRQPSTGFANAGSSSPTVGSMDLPISKPPALRGWRRRTR